jgi:hypothetical protein
MKESSHVRQHRAAQMQMCSILQDKGRITPKAFGGHQGCLFSVGDMGFFFFSFESDRNDTCYNFLLYLIKLLQNLLM